ncbi:MAG: hypothetical protein HOO96_26055 [Polyangiaceae bacterium]|nr:hypothetical protein [Polyangiaceae bacterium]
MEVFSDVDCSTRPRVLVVGGPALSDVPTRAPSTTSSHCDATGRVGRVVVLPSDGDVVALAVVTRLDGEPPDQCASSAPPKGCIVARRQLRFVEHRALQMRVDLRVSCADVVCPQDQTCVTGLCVSAATDCQGDCTESSLLPKGPLGTGLPRWLPVASMPTARSEPGVALASDGRIYVAGGRITNSTWSAANEAYDAATDRWSTATPLPVASHAMAAAAGRDGRIFLFGGTPQTRSAQVFDPTLQRWTPLPNMPTARSFVRAALARDGRLYVIGGDNLQGTPNLKAVEAFDPATAAWQARASLPTGRGNLAVTTGPDGHIYAFGGDAINSGPGPTFDVSEVYDAATDSWRAIARLPTARSGLYSALGPDDRIYVNFGNAVRAYTASRDAWEDVARPQSEHGAGPLVQGPDGRIYIIGGQTAGSPTAVVEAYGPVIGVTPAGGSSGPMVQVTGSNFAPYARVSITLDGISGAVLGAGATDAYGTLPPLALPVPAGVVPGPHAVVAVDDRSQFPVRRNVVLPP